MVGGGEGAFIGAVHRIAARLDDHYTLLAGALSSSAPKSIRSGEAIGLKRVYPNYTIMAQAEAAREDGIEAVAIVTPNSMHAPVAQAFLKAGIHVICDKPVTTSLKDALRLQSIARKHGRIFALTHNYTGYPMVRQARRMVSDGMLGEIRVVQVEYAQDWLTERLEATGQKQAAWRSDPKRNGVGGCIGDIGTHAYNLADYITGLQVTELCAELSTFVKGRTLDDDVQVMLRYANGARGLLWASQVAPGNENNLHIRVFGSKGGLEWKQEHPNHLHWSPFGQATQLITRGGSAANADAARVTRIPSGHPEGYLEGFATLYSEIAQAIRAARPGPGESKPDAAANFPTIADGVKGMAFIEAAVKSSAKGGRWVKP
jgi:predicted dehydrogenase